MTSGASTGPRDRGMSHRLDPPFLGPDSKPKHFAAEAAKIAKAHQVSTTWAQHLDQNVPDCATLSLRQFPMDIADFFAGLAHFAVQLHFLG